MQLLSVLVGLVLSAGQLSAQTLLDSLRGDSVPPPLMRYGVVTGKAREKLVKAWDERNPQQLERAYCVTHWTVAQGAVPWVKVYLVEDVAEPDTVTRASPMGITFKCPTGLPNIHIHPPVTCSREEADGVVDASSCRLGGNGAYMCSASPQDLVAWLLGSVLAPFNVIQCDRNAFLFQYTTLGPSGLTISPR